MAPSPEESSYVTVLPKGSGGFYGGIWGSIKVCIGIYGMRMYTQELLCISCFGLLSFVGKGLAGDYKIVPEEELHWRVWVAASTTPGLNSFAKVCARKCQKSIRECAQSDSRHPEKTLNPKLGCCFGTHLKLLYWGNLIIYCIFLYMYTYPLW